MNRRQLLKTLGLGALAAPLAVLASRGPESKPLWAYSDDEGLYEQGVFVPTLVDNGGHYQKPTMYYQRIGNQVYVSGIIELQP